MLALATTHRVTVELVLGRKRHPRVIAARRALIAFLRDRHCLSYKDIGDLLGRDAAGIRLLMVGTKTSEVGNGDTLAADMRTPLVPPGATLQ